ncbi:hypothetical protein SLE2022_182770 [Rubroshorea leprosula]
MIGPCAQTTLGNKRGGSNRDPRFGHEIPQSRPSSSTTTCLTTSGTNRAGPANPYQEGSMLSFEGQRIQDWQNIVSKLTSLSFQQCQNSISTVRLPAVLYHWRVACLVQR